MARSLFNKTDAHVSTVDGNKITVKETIFYAFSGSQESDYGKIAGLTVLKAEKQIFYSLSENHTLKVADPLPCGGTHIKRTGEIGKIRLKRVNPGKGKERIEIYVD